MAITSSQGRSVLQMSLQILNIQTFNPKNLP